ncbi:nucleotidyltransferase family protein [Pyxidicoccus fallax]|uniref:Nucleotidyltransferase family protein n=1 Tax=Pyxidicoccus fallax TaxID=394095 RepID=A0A848LI29_9BACT|nr:nucleotidyltransferase family protein [Pyxidicoccus fallax]NMO17178.1 nucleotidyltransferase family protein [Pyxidicoccus fallax]NPC80462.1 nucleotidyltransferase family protein [Pyxidicoccus fallax]
MAIGVVLLAAGGSSRLGRPKQLLLHEGRSLVRRAAESALAAECGPVVVVLGAHREAVTSELTGLPVRTVEHADWAAGPGGSLVAGVRALTQDATVDAVLVMLCDQLRVDSAHLRALVETWQRTGAAVVASTYEGTQGVPALFSRAVFPELEALGPEQGARRVIARDASRVAEVPLPGGGEDVDTAADLARLR